MSKKIFSCLLVLILTASAVFASYPYHWGFLGNKIKIVESSPFSINAKYLARSGSGLAVEDSSLALETNPSALTNKNTGFSVPYLSVALRNAKGLVDTIAEPSIWANYIDPTDGALLQVASGFEYRNQNFGVDFHVADNVYSCAPIDNCAGRDMYLMNELTMNGGFGFAGKKYWAWNMSLSYGVYAGMQYALFSSGLKAGHISDCISKEDFGRMLEMDATYVGILSTSLSAGVTLNVPYGFSFAAVLRNPCLYYNRQEFDYDNNRVSDCVFNWDYYAGALSNMSYGTSWDGDIGVTWNTAKLWSRFHYFFISADLINIRELCTNPYVWPNHLKIGLEYCYENITLRAGWQISGPSVGLGFDMYAVHLDLSYNHVMTCTNSTTADQLAVTIRLGS